MQIPAGELAREGGPEGLSLGGADVQAQHLGPTATIIASGVGVSTFSSSPRRAVISAVVGDPSGSKLAVAARPDPVNADDHTVRYKAVQGARTGFPARVALHHRQGYAPSLS